MNDHCNISLYIFSLVGLAMACIQAKTNSSKTAAIFCTNKFMSNTHATTSDPYLCTPWNVSYQEKYSHLILMYVTFMVKVIAQTYMNSHCAKLLPEHTSHDCKPHFLFMSFIKITDALYLPDTSITNKYTNQEKAQAYVLKINIQHKLPPAGNTDITLQTHWHTQMFPNLPLGTITTVVLCLLLGAVVSPSSQSV
jgi:hypothetical protein